VTEDTRAIGHCILVDTHCYPIAAVHKTLYALSNLTDYELRSAESDCVEVRLYPKAADVFALETSFRQILADFTIQVQINGETAAIRKALVTAALAESLRPRGLPR
jgi:His-Xaa-Ser system protein HxsD